MLSLASEQKRNRTFLNCITHHCFRTKSLQVPCFPPNTIFCCEYQSKKRVLPFTFEMNFSASMTVEAALVLPMFLFLAYALLLPIRWIDTQRKVQMITEYFCEDLSQYAYIAERWNDKFSEKDFGLDPQIFSDGAAGLFLKGKVGGYADDVTINVSRVPDEENHICFEVTYTEKIPYFSVLSKGVSMNAAARRRCWTGLDGKLKENGDNAISESEETMVYVGAGMGRYHLSAECHYISNQYECIPLSQIAAKRTSGGKKLTACSACAGDCKSGDMVYVTSEGTHYHKVTTCNAMVSYVRKVPLSEVEHLGCCSYCLKM